MDDLTDPREMRQRLTQVAYGRARMDGREPSGWNISPVYSLVRNIMRMGEMRGLSGEDVMTVLAYNALLSYEQLMDRALTDLALNPRPPTLFPVDATKSPSDTSPTRGDPDEQPD